MQKIELKSMAAVTEALRDGVEVYCDITSPITAIGTYTEKVEWRNRRHTGTRVLAIVDHRNPDFFYAVKDSDFHEPNPNGWACKHQFYAVI